MKNNWKRTLMLTAAVLTLSAAAAYGQNPAIANIPFAFRTLAGEQPAGQYQLVSISQTSPVFRLRNLETLKATTLGIGTPAGESNNVRPRLVFHCNDESGCVLFSVWADDGRGWSYKSHGKPSTYEQVAVIYFER